MQEKQEIWRKVDESSDDQQSDDLSLSIPLPPTPASVCSANHLLVLHVVLLACWERSLKKA